MTTSETRPSAPPAIRTPYLQRTPVYVGRDPRAAALRIALIYALFGTAWIVFSDLVLEALVSSDTIHRYHLQTVKGWLFVLVTAVLVYLLIQRTVAAFRRTETLRHTAAQTLTTVIEASPLAIITLDLEDNVQSWNPAAERLFGWMESEVRGRGLPIVPERRAPIYRANNERLHRDERIEAMEVSAVKKNGDVVDVALWASALKDSRGNSIGNVRVYADVSERKRIEQEVRQLNENLERRVAERTALLEEVNAELGAFSFTVSHDLRIPLRSLQAIAKQLLETQSERFDESGRSDALRIVGAAARMERQVEDLLEYSRLSRAELKLERVSLTLVVHELLGRLERDPDFRDAQVVVQEPLGWVRAHPLTLQYAVLNLLMNAVTHVSAGTRPAIHISNESRGPLVRLSIQDNATDLTEGDREKILHALAGSAIAVSDAGLGLTLVRRGIERMGGRVGVEADVAKGSTYWIELRRED